MSIARRNFLRSAIMSTISAGLAFSSAQLVFGQQARRGEIRPARKGGPVDADSDFPIPMEAQQDALFYFRPRTFSPYVGDIFQAPDALGKMIELKLTRVSEYKMNAATRISTRKSRQTECFSLTFSAAERLPSFSSIHQISHPALGEFDLFLTSHETENGTFLYEAVFNHIRY
jgi:hypothetical protein